MPDFNAVGYWKNKCWEAERELETMTHIAEGYKTDNQFLQEKREQLKGELADLSERMKQATAHIQQEDDEVEDLKRELAEWKAQAKGWIRESARLRKAIEDARHEEGCKGDCVTCELRDALENLEGVET